MKRKLVFVVFLIYIFVGCSKMDEYNIIKLELELSMMAEDGVNYILVNPSDFLIANDYIYAAEKDVSHVVVFDKDFNYLNTIGKYGEGPEDFYHLGALVSSDTAIYVHDRGHNRLISVVSQKKDYIELPVDDAIKSPNFILNGKEEICYIVADGEPPIYCGNLFNGSVSRFGKLVEHSGTPQLNRSLGFIFSIENLMLYLRPSEPEILIYDKEFNEIGVYDLKNTLLFEYSLKLSEEIYNDPSKNNQRVLLIKDAYVWDNELFILIYNRELNDEGEVFTKSNKVISLEVNNEKVEVKSIYDLSYGNDQYSQVFVQGEDLFAFDPYAEKIDKFKR